MFGANVRQLLVGLSQPSGLSPVGAGAIAKITGADMALTTDQLFTWLVPQPAKFLPRRIVAVRVTGAFNTACAGGIYPAAAKAGTAIVAAGQSWAALTGANTLVDATVVAAATLGVLTTNTVYLALTTGNGIALTADVYLFGDVF